MEVVVTVCVYGDFKKGDVRLSVMKKEGTHQFAFQNILKEAGYEAILFYITDEDIKQAEGR